MASIAIMLAVLFCVSYFAAWVLTAVYLEMSLKRAATIGFISGAVGLVIGVISLAWSYALVTS